MRPFKLRGIPRITAIAAVLLAVVLLIRWAADSNAPAGTPPAPAPLPAAAESPPSPPCAETRRLRIRSGETFVAALGRLGLTPSAAHAAATALRPVYPVERVHPGHLLAVTFQQEQPLRLEYEVNDSTRLRASWREDGRIHGKVHVQPYVVRLAFVRGEIESSLFAGILAVGEDAALADLLASLFEYDIDFNRDIRAGDSFRLLVEKRFLRGEFAGYGPVHAAEVTNRGRSIRIVRYSDAHAGNVYFHPDGRSVRKMFLRCPLPFMRVTSSYGRRRHPVLGFSARHNGIDLGAPRGTPVKATASGVVTHAGTHRTKGRYVQLRHPNGFASHYYHLSGIRRGVRRGQAVTQGQVIGYVGNTGLSTGPHLHYGVRHNGRFINPLHLKPPSKNPITPGEKAAFLRHCDQVFFTMSAFAWMRERGLQRVIPMGEVAESREEPSPGADISSLPVVSGGDLEIHPGG